MESEHRGGAEDIRKTDSHDVVHGKVDVASATRLVCQLTEPLTRRGPLNRPAWIRGQFNFN